MNPEKKHIAETVTEHTVTPKKVLKILIDVSAGKIISAEISNVPIIFIPNTTVTAVKTAIREL